VCFGRRVGWFGLFGCRSLSWVGWFGRRSLGSVDLWGCIGAGFGFGRRCLDLGLALT